MKTTATISPTQFAILVVAGYIAVGVFQFPRELLYYAGPDALYGFLMDCVAAYGGLWLWFQVNGIRPGEQLSGFAGKLVTPFLAWPIWLLTVAIHLVLLMGVLANFGFVMTTFFLPDTPTWVIGASACLTGMYVAWFDTPVLGRTAEVVFIPTFILSLILGVLVLTKATSGYALLPSPDLHLSPILSAAYHSFYIFWGYEVTVTLYPFVRRADQATARRYAFLAMLGTFGFFLFGYAITLGIQGPYLMIVSQWPAVSSLRLVDVSAFVINKLGLLVVVLWGLFVVSFASVRVWCLAHDVLPVFKLKSVTWYRAFIVFFGLLGIYGSTLFPTIADLVVFAQTWILPAMVVYNFVLPPLMLLGGWWQARRSGKPEPDVAA